MKGDLVSGVEAAYARVAGRMRGLPVCNPDLHVELIGMRSWQGVHLGVLVTPWMISLLLMPGERTLRPLGADERERWKFPSGEYEFMGGTDPALGHYQTCSLISPPLEFESQEEARAVAFAALYALLEAGDNIAIERESHRQPLSRRGFLTGGLFSRRE
jgi:[NiFe] hydrogenase assembly HybE family chaperone